MQYFIYLFIYLFFNDAENKLSRRIMNVRYVLR